jgi:hypothetical protein
MNKNTKILAAIFFVLMLSYWLINKQPWRTTQRAITDFAIEDTSVVTKIFMANKKGEKVLLEKDAANNWLVNSKVPADAVKIKLLLATLHDIQIQKPIPPSMHNTAMGILASRGIKTEVYQGDKLLKTIYVGSETPDQTGTFMLIEGDDQAYSIHIPGFVGYLTPRFFLTEIKWRNKLVFDIAPENIAEIQITYPQNEKESFTFLKEAFKSGSRILNHAGNLVKADTLQVKMLLYSFSQKYAEGYYDDSTFTKSERDSVMGLPAFCTIRVKQTNGFEQKIALYNKLVGEKTKDRFDEQGNELVIDPEKYYAKITGIEQMASIQEYAFRRVLVKASFLIK